MKILLQHKTIVPKPMFLASPFSNWLMVKMLTPAFNSHLFLSEIAEQTILLESSS